MRTDTLVLLVTVLCLECILIANMVNQPAASVLKLEAKSKSGSQEGAAQSPEHRARAPLHLFLGHLQGSTGRHPGRQHMQFEFVC